MGYGGIVAIPKTVNKVMKFRKNHNGRTAPYKGGGVGDVRPPAGVIAWSTSRYGKRTGQRFNT